MTAFRKKVFFQVFLFLCCFAILRVVAFDDDTTTDVTDISTSDVTDTSTSDVTATVFTKTTTVVTESTTIQSGCGPHPNNENCKNSSEPCDVECRNGFVGSDGVGRIRFVAHCNGTEWDKKCVEARCGDEFEIRFGYKDTPFNSSYGCNTKPNKLKKCRCNEYYINKNKERREVIVVSDDDEPDVYTFCKTGEAAGVFGECRALCPNEIPKPLDSKDFVDHELEDCIAQFRKNFKQEFCEETEFHCKPKDGIRRKMLKKEEFRNDNKPPLFCGDRGDWEVRAECTKLCPPAAHAIDDCSNKAVSEKCTIKCDGSLRTRDGKMTFKSECIEDGKGTLWDGSFEANCTKAECGSIVSFLNMENGCKTDNDKGNKTCNCDTVSENGQEIRGWTDGEVKDPYAICPDKGGFLEISGECLLACNNTIDDLKDITLHFDKDALKECIDASRYTHDFHTCSTLKCEKGFRLNYDIKQLPSLNAAKSDREAVGFYCSLDGEWINNDLRCLPVCDTHPENKHCVGKFENETCTAYCGEKERTAGGRQDFVAKCVEKDGKLVWNATSDNSCDLLTFKKSKEVYFRNGQDKCLTGGENEKPHCQCQSQDERGRQVLGWTDGEIAYPYLAAERIIDPKTEQPRTIVDIHGQCLPVCVGEIPGIPFGDNTTLAFCKDFGESHGVRHRCDRFRCLDRYHVVNVGPYCDEEGEWVTNDVECKKN